MASPNLFKQLDKSLQYCSIDGRRFLPRDKLDEIITKDSIKNGLPRNFIGRLFSDGRTTKLINGSRKLVAILVYIGEQSAIKRLLRDGLTDDDLPFRPVKDTENSSIVESSRGKVIRSFLYWKSDAKVDAFLEKQWLFLAPVLDISGTSPQLDHQYSLPFMNAEVVSSHSDSTVYKAELHSSHVAGIRNIRGNLVIAVKELKDAENFSREQKNLNRLRKVRDDHLIQYMFCCERKSGSVIVFPWANGGNMKDFWDHNTNNRGSPELVLWCLQQMLGITHALRALHQGNFRHGDLKPENILYFDEPSKNKLVIADVGVSRIHQEATGLRVGPTTTKATTPSYEAPEVYLNKYEPRSRQYDIWSMACILLEFVVWMVYGFDAVNSFAIARCKNEPELKSWFFIIDNFAAYIHPAVIQALEALRGDIHCRPRTALGDLIDLITNDLLLIPVDSRARADVLYERMGEIVRKANNDPGYLPQIVPKKEVLAPVFQPQEVQIQVQRYTSEDMMVDV